MYNQEIIDEFLLPQSSNRKKNRENCFFILNVNKFDFNEYLTSEQ